MDFNYLAYRLGFAQDTSSIPLPKIEKLINNSLLPHQVDFITDASKYDYLVSCGGRQSGKSHVVSMQLMKTALKYKGCLQIYICQRSRMLYDMCYSRIDEFFMNHNLPSMGKTIGHDYRFNNGSLIMGIGLDNSYKLENYIRGKSDSLTFVLDEAGINHHVTFDEFFYVIDPILGNQSRLRIKYKDPNLHQLVIVQGNPWDSKGTVLQGAWEREESYSLHHYQWDSFLNVYYDSISQALRYLSMHKNELTDYELKILSMDKEVVTKEMLSLVMNPEFRKMYLGEPGKLDDRMTVFPHIKTDLHKQLQPTHFLVGIDYGTRDYCSIVALAVNRGTKLGNVVHSYFYSMDKYLEDVPKGNFMSYFSEQVWSTYKQISIDYNIPIDKIYGVADVSDRAWTNHIGTKVRLADVSKTTVGDSLDYTRLFLNQELIAVPQDSVLYEELTSCTYLKDSDGMITPDIDEDIRPRHGGHFDVLAAFRYALTLYVNLCGIPK